jgi:ABC-type glycerol-3-phosphate transport system substrate-binding protein
MKRILGVLLCMAVLISTFAGCSSGKESSGTSDSSVTQQTLDPNKKIELKMWTMLTTNACMTNMNNQLAEFTKKYPNITVKLEPMTFDNVYARLMTAVQGNSLPDVLDCIEGHVAFLQSKNAIVPVDNLIDDLGGKSAFTQKYLQWASKDDKTWALPDWSLHQEVWYRTDLYKKYGLSIPKTWDELAQNAKKLNIDSNNDGKTDVYGMAIPLGRNMVAQQTYSQFLYSAGVNIFDPATGKYAFGDNKAMAVKAMDAMIKIYKESSPSGSIDWTWTDFRTAMVKGTVAQTNEWGAIIAQAKEQNPQMLDNLSCFPMPGPEGAPKGSCGGTYYMCVTKSTSDRQLASELLLKFLFQKDMLAQRANTRPVYALPTMTAAFNSDTYNSDDMVKKFSKEIKDIYIKVLPTEERNGFEHGLNTAASEIESSNIMGDAIQNVLLKGWSTTKAVDWLDQQLQSIINK